MEAGPELDRLIAEKVMKEQPKDFGCPTCGYDGIYGNREVPGYSTDIAAAWLVLEKLKTLEPYKSRTLKLQWFGSGWVCYPWHEDELTDEYESTDTASLAICRAALMPLVVQS